MDALDSLMLLMKGDKKKGKFPAPNADKDSDGVPDKPQGDPEGDGDAQAMADAYNGVVDKDDSADVGDEAAAGDDSFDAAGGEGGDEDDDSFDAAGGEGDEGGDTDGDGIADDEDDDHDGDGMSDDEELADVADGAGEGDFPGGEDEQGGGSPEVAQLVMKIAAAEKDFYAAKGMHGAGHHKAEGAMDVMHKLVRKLVRSIAGAHGVDPSAKPGEEGDDSGKAPPFGKKPGGEGDEGAPSKARPFKGKKDRKSNPFARGDDGGDGPDDQDEPSDDSDSDSDSGDEGDSEKKKKTPFGKAVTGVMQMLGPVAQDVLCKAAGLPPKRPTLTHSPRPAGPAAGGGFIDWGAVVSANADGSPGHMTKSEAPAAPAMARASGGSSAQGPASRRITMPGLDSNGSPLRQAAREKRMNEINHPAIEQPMRKAARVVVTDVPRLDAIDMLKAVLEGDRQGQLRKSAGHKYISRKRNVHGGYDYVYEHPKTKQKHKFSTSHRSWSTGEGDAHLEPGSKFHNVTSREKGSDYPDSQGGASEWTEPGGKKKNNSHAHGHIGDDHIKAMHEHASRDTLRLKAKKDRSGERDKAQYGQVDEQGSFHGSAVEHKVAYDQMKSPLGSTVPGKSRAHMLSPLGLHHAAKHAAKVGDRKALDMIGNALPRASFRRPSQYTAQSEHESGARALVEKYGTGGSRAEKSMGRDGSGRALRKGFDTYEQQSSNLPDDLLYEYLIGAIEESLHSSIRKSDTQPTGHIMADLLKAARTNGDLKRALGTFRVTQSSIDSVLAERGLLKSQGQSLSNGLIPDERHYTPQAPWMRPGEYVGVVVAPPADNNVAHLIRDDRLDPCRSLAVARAEQHQSLWRGGDSRARVNYDAACAVHGRDISKSQNLHNPYVTCSCS